MCASSTFLLDYTLLGGSEKQCRFRWPPGLSNTFLKGISAGCRHYGDSYHSSCILNISSCAFVEKTVLSQPFLENNLLLLLP